ncbi:unnamed protein product [Arctogadus glacialis]
MAVSCESTKKCHISFLHDGRIIFAIGNMPFHRFKRQDSVDLPGLALYCRLPLFLKGDWGCLLLDPGAVPVPGGDTLEDMMPATVQLGVERLCL